MKRVFMMIPFAAMSIGLFICMLCGAPRGGVQELGYVILVGLISLLLPGKWLADIKDCERLEKRIDELEMELKKQELK